MVFPQFQIVSMTFSENWSVFVIWVDTCIPVYIQVEVCDGWPGKKVILFINTRTKTPMLIVCLFDFSGAFFASLKSGISCTQVRYCLWFIHLNPHSHPHPLHHYEHSMDFNLFMWGIAANVRFIYLRLLFVFVSFPIFPYPVFICVFSHPIQHMILRCMQTQHLHNFVSVPRQITKDSVYCLRAQSEIVGFKLMFVQLEHLQTFELNLPREDGEKSIKPFLFV